MILEGAVEEFVREDKAMMVRVEYMGKIYLCTVMTDWVDMIEELEGGGVLNEDNLLWDKIATLALREVNDEKKR